MKSKVNSKSKKPVNSINSVKSVKSNNSVKKLQQLSLSIGNFIRYWGFRKVHGAIWTQVYLSKTPLSCSDLTRRLGLSKALISPALEELCHFKLISEAPAPNEKVKVYQASEKIEEVIKHVLNVREKKMLTQIVQDFSKFKDSNKKLEDFDDQRVQSLEDMISSATLMLDIMLDQKVLLDLPSILQK